MAANSSSREGAAVARWGHVLRTTRLARLVPLSWLVIVLALGLATVAAVEADRARRDSRDPRPTSLVRILADKPMDNRNVEVKGILLPDARIIPPSRRKGPPGAADFLYVAMLDEPVEVPKARRPPRILLVRFPGDVGPGQPRQAVVSGLLRPPDSALARALDESGWRIAGLAVEPRYVLISGLAPRPAWLSGGVAAVAAALAIWLLHGEVASRLRGRLGQSRPTH